MTPASQRASVAVLGLGSPGSALVRACFAQGYPTASRNRSREATDALAALGATVAESPEAAISESSVALICVSNNSAIPGLLDSLDPSALDPRPFSDLESVFPSVGSTSRRLPKEAAR